MKLNKIKLNEQQPDFITPEELAGLLDVSVRTLANWRTTGAVNLPFVKVGRCVRYRYEHVNEYLSRHTFNDQEVAK